VRRHCCPGLRVKAEGGIWDAGPSWAQTQADIQGECWSTVGGGGPKGLDHPGPNHRQFQRIVLDYEKWQRDLGAGHPGPQQRQFHKIVLGSGKRRRDLGG
jgi:hypothetical protein